MNKYILPLTGVLIETLSDVVLKFYVKNKNI